MPFQQVCTCLDRVQSGVRAAPVQAQACCRVCAVHSKAPPFGLGFAVYMRPEGVCVSVFGGGLASCGPCLPRVEVEHVCFIEAPPRVLLAVPC
jgi:hypothetical protein